MARLADKVALITGGESGIGLATGRLAMAGPSPLSRSISNKTDQAGDA